MKSIYEDTPGTTRSKSKFFFFFCDDFCWSETTILRGDIFPTEFPSLSDQQSLQRGPDLKPPLFRYFFWGMKIQVHDLSHSIHVWYIYLHLP